MGYYWENSILNNSMQHIHVGVLIIYDEYILLSNQRGFAVVRDHLLFT